MAYKYYYIDDMVDKVQGLIVGLNEKDVLEIDIREPTGVWEDEINLLINDRKENKFQGLLLDLRLQDEANSKQKISKYRGSSLAQELRILAKEKTFSDCPIILLSASDNLRASLDLTSKDLFDLIIEKDYLGQTFSFDKARMLLVSLARGYERLLLRRGISELFGTDLSLLDKRLLNDLNVLHNNKPIHIYAGFIIKQLLERTGPLVDIMILSARLGVNYIDSEGWSALIDILKPCTYKGVFSDGWIRWWYADVEKWWNDNFPNKILRLLDAGDRVKLLMDKFQIALISYRKTPRSKSDKFWTVCKGTHQPLDPTDGFIVGDQDNLYPWQEKEYICIDEALERKEVSKWKSISPLEKSRYDKLIKTIAIDGGN